MVQIPEAEWQKIKATLSNLQIVVSERDRALAELQRDHDDLINDVLTGAPECWDGDESGESLVVSYVRSLDASTTDMPGHRDGCNCWE